jgi:hypothetical protein
VEVHYFKINKSDERSIIRLSIYSNNILIKSNDELLVICGQLTRRNEKKSANSFQISLSDAQNVSVTKRDISSAEDPTVSENIRQLMRSIECECSSP